MNDRRDEFDAKALALLGFEGFALRVANLLGDEADGKPHCEEEGKACGGLREREVLRVARSVLSRIA